MSVRAIAGWAVGLLVAATVVIGYLVVGPPSEARRRRIDERRLADLQQIALSIDVYWTRTERLPATLDDLPAADLHERTRDPATAVPYPYRITTADKYELCADFEREDRAPRGPMPSEFWAHGAGRQCFTLQPKAVAR